jgi:hypothetical protein
MTRFDRSPRRGHGSPARRQLATRLILGLLSITLAITVVGCDSSAEPFTRVAVDGNVTLDEQPLDSAVIRFIPTGSTQGPKTSFEIRQGRFVADRDTGPPVGSHRVEIEAVDPQWRHDDEAAIEQLTRSRTRNIKRVRLPDAYHTNSSLTATLATPPTDSGGDAPQSLTFTLSSRLR